MLKIKILGVPLDLGQERRGVDMGPSAVRAAGLNHALKSRGHAVEDAGNIRVRLKDSGVNVFTMREIDEQGMRTVAERPSHSPRKARPGSWYPSTWTRSIPTKRPGVGTPVRGGITFREAHLAMEMVADSRKMIAFELVETNPIIDLMNKTAILGVGLAASALGKKIL
jgi:arginase